MASKAWGGGGSGLTAPLALQLGIKGEYIYCKKEGNNKTVLILIGTVTSHDDDRV